MYTKWPIKFDVLHIAINQQDITTNKAKLDYTTIDVANA